MNTDQLRELALRVASGSLGVDEFVAEAQRWRVADLGDARVDLDRRRRCGFPEVIYGEGKSIDQIERIARVLLADGAEALATRVSADKAARLVEIFPEARYNATARTLRVPSPSAAAAPQKPRRGNVVVVTAGTIDLPIAEEAKETAAWMGTDVELIQDCGVAGPQRLLAELPRLRRADAIVVVAGMEGALAGVVGGHVDCPVIAVPTSVGYGASLGGLTAMLGMLTSCASNVTTVNIDAGFKGGYLAGLIALRTRRDAT
jgi:NCAIR mutase (PurE)-related protein